MKNKSEILQELRSIEGSCPPEKLEMFFNDEPIGFFNNEEYLNLRIYVFDNKIEGVHFFVDGQNYDLLIDGRLSESVKGNGIYRGVSDKVRQLHQRIKFPNDLNELKK